MGTSRVDIRYAKALLALAKEKNVLDEVNGDMKMLSSVCKESHDLSLVLRSPIINTDKKLSIMDQVFSQKISKLSMGFINILTKKKREGNIEGIADSFQLIYNADKNITTAKVTSAIKLDKTLKDKVLGIIQTTFDNKDVDLEEHVDTSLIGGFVLRVGDRQVDASISNKIVAMQNEFNKNPYVKDL